MNTDRGGIMEAEIICETKIDYVSSNTEISLCKCCDEKGLSCCRVPKAEQGLVPPISMAEIACIRKHIDMFGTAGRSFVVRKPNSKSFIKKMLDLFPYRPHEVRHVFPRRGMHHELEIVNERCSLLGPHGCSLPRQARPLLCRIYPFWFYNGEPYIFANDQCLALRSCKTVRELCLALGTNLEDLHALHNQLCQKWGFSQEPRSQAANEGKYPYQSSSPMLRQGFFSICNGA